MEPYFFTSIVCCLGCCLLVVGVRFGKVRRRARELEALVCEYAQKIENQQQDLERQSQKLSTQSDLLLAQSEYLREVKEERGIFTCSEQKTCANVLFDIKVPLVLIDRALSCIVRRRRISTEMFTELQRIEINSKYILQLLNKTLDKLQQEMRHRQINLRQGDIVNECRKTVNAFMSRAGERQLELCFSAEKRKFRCHFDFEKLNNILACLVSNAIKFTPKGGDIICELSFSDGNIVLWVCDSGVGIPEDCLPYVFDRYYQVGKSTKANIEGEGLGLARAKDCIEILKGTICVESTEGKGSCFRVCLPIEHINQEEVACGKKNITGGVSTKKEGVEHGEVGLCALRKTVLVVEDNQYLLLYLKEILSEDYNVIEASNGKEALEYIKRNDTIDLILSDWMMPEMSGVELCKTLKNDVVYCTIPFVLLTALSEIHDQKEGYLAGIDGYIIKPLDVELLKLKIANLMERNSQIRDAVEAELRMRSENAEVKTFDDMFMDRIKKVVEKELSDPNFGQNELGEKLGLSQMQLYRRLKEQVKMSPNEYIRSVRLKRAAKLLENKGLIINEVSYMVGFSDPKYFSRCFSKEMGICPSKYRDKLN